MEKLQPFQETERANYQTTFVDGLADLCLGGWLLAYGFLMETPAPWIGAVLAGLLLPIWRHLRARFAEPRLGFVRFGEERRQQQQHRTLLLRCGFFIVAFFSVATVWAVANHTQSGGETIGWGAVSLGLTVAAILAVLAFVYDFRRLLSHAFLILLTFALGQWRGLYPPVYTSLAGGVVMIYGAFIYARFLHDFPLPTDD
jgi:MFS family permease